MPYTKKECTIDAAVAIYDICVRRQPVGPKGVDYAAAAAEAKRGGETFAELLFPAKKKAAEK